MGSSLADFLRQCRQWQDAADAYEEALALTSNDVERAFLTRRLIEARANLPG